MAKKRLVRAVQKKDLDEFLRTAGLWDNMVDGKIECSRCNRKLSKEEIALFIIEKQKVKIFCSRVDCIEWGGEKNIAG